MVKFCNLKLTLDKIQLLYVGTSSLQIYYAPFVGVGYKLELNKDKIILLSIVAFPLIVVFKAHTFRDFLIKKVRDYLQEIQLIPGYVNIDTFKQFKNQLD